MSLSHFWSHGSRKVTKSFQASFDRPIFSVALLLLAIWLFASIALHGSFGDEQENFVAAWLITRGLVPYRDFFFHHAPLPYFLGAPLYWLGSTPWVWFRWVMVGWFSLIGVVTTWLIHPKWRWGVSLGWVGLALLAPLLHLQMFLAESWLVPALVSLTLVVTSFWRFGAPRFSAVLWLWLVLGWVAIGSSIVTIPSVAVLLAGIGLAAWRRGKKENMQWRKWLLAALILYGSWFGYFAWHRALSEAWWAVVTYNLQYYFPLRLAGSATQVQAGYGITVVTNFWQYVVQMTQAFMAANVTFGQTLLGIVKAAVKQTPWNQLWNWLGVAVTEWNHRMVTLPMLSWLLCVVVIGRSLWKRQWWFIFWWVILLVTFRGRENENFKLGPYYTIIIMAAAVVWLESWREKHWWISSLIGLILIGWVTVVWPIHQSFQRETTAIIPSATVAAGERLKQNLAAHDAATTADSDQRIFILGGNPVHYLLSQRLPAHRYFYYHPWFHGAPPMRQAVTGFLKTNTTAPVVLESEIDGSSLDYAIALETLVRARAATHSAGVYWF